MICDPVMAAAVGRVLSARLTGEQLLGWKDVKEGDEQKRRFWTYKVDPTKNMDRMKIDRRNLEANVDAVVAVGKAVGSGTLHELTAEMALRSACNDHNLVADEKSIGHEGYVLRTMLSHLRRVWAAA